MTILDAALNAPCNHTSELPCHNVSLLLYNIPESLNLNLRGQENCMAFLMCNMLRL